MTQMFQNDLLFRWHPLGKDHTTVVHVLSSGLCTQNLIFMVLQSSIQVHHYGYTQSSGHTIILLGYPIPLLMISPYDVIQSSIHIFPLMY